MINAEILLQTIAIAASQQIKLAAKPSFFRIGVQTTHFQLHILSLANIQIFVFYFLLANLSVQFVSYQVLMFYFLLANLCVLFVSYQVFLSDPGKPGVRSMGPLVSK